MRRKIVLDTMCRADGLFDAGRSGHSGKIISGKEQAGVFGYTHRDFTEPLRVIQTGLWQPIAPAMRARYERCRAAAEQMLHFAVHEVLQFIRREQREVRLPRAADEGGERNVPRRRPLRKQRG